MADTAVYNAAHDLIAPNLAAGRGDKPAFIDRARRITYGELDRETARLAYHLARLGVRREERVAMVLLDTVDFPVIFLGAIRAGIVPVPLNTLLTPEQYTYILADTRARIAFVSEPLLPVIVSLPFPPTISSEPLPPTIWSRPLLPRSIQAASVPNAQCSAVPKSTQLTAAR